MDTQENNNSKVKNIIAIIGFIILLVIGIWSAFQVIRFVPRLFTDKGVATQTTENKTTSENKGIVVNISKDTINSGEPVTITWNYTGNNNGIYSFSYACTKDSYLQIFGRSIPCNDPYNISTLNTSLEIIPFTDSNKTNIKFAITYTNNKGKSIRDTKTLSVINNNAVTSSVVSKTNTTKENTTTYKKPKREPIEPKPIVQKERAITIKRPTEITKTRTIIVPRTSNPYGIADLKVEIVSIGDINKFGTFQPKGIVHQYSRGAVKFKVTNIGTKETGNWNFSAILPSNGGYAFNSQMQASLMPGSSTEIFMTFDQLIPGVYNFTVSIDPLNYIPELSEQNNIAWQSFTVLNY